MRTPALRFIHDDDFPSRITAFLRFGFFVFSNRVPIPRDHVFEYKFFLNLLSILRTNQLFFSNRNMMFSAKIIIVLSIFHDFVSTVVRYLDQCTLLEFFKLKVAQEKRKISIICIAVSVYTCDIPVISKVETVAK